MEVGVIVICIVTGALICFALFGIGVCIGRCDKEQSNRDSDIRIYIPMRYRNRSGDKRDSKPSPEEIDEVLDYFRVGASDCEKRVIDYLKEERHEERPNK